jgi:hypothetical protein
MSRSNRSAAASVPFTRSSRPGPIFLEALIRAHHDLLVQTARHHLGNYRSEAEDVVQDVYLSILQGHVVISADPCEALDDLLQAVVDMA